MRNKSGPKSGYQTVGERVWELWSWCVSVKRSRIHWTTPEHVRLPTDCCWRRLSGFSVAVKVNRTSWEDPAGFTQCRSVMAVFYRLQKVTVLSVYSEYVCLPAWPPAILVSLSSYIHSFNNFCGFQSFTYLQWKYEEIPIEMKFRGAVQTRILYRGVSGDTERTTQFPQIFKKFWSI